MHQYHPTSKLISYLVNLDVGYCFSQSFLVEEVKRNEVTPALFCDRKKLFYFVYWLIFLTISYKKL